MTEQEAITILYKMPNRVPLKVFTDGIAKEIDEMIQVAQAALEKRIPREIKRKMCDGCKKEDCQGCERYYNRCPSCGGGLDRDSGELFKYCPKCGQALSL